MLKKVVFAAVLALGFVTSFSVGASVDTGSKAQCGGWDCCPFDPDGAC
jgi:hypothetical protein